MNDVPPPPPPHTVWEDAQALLAAALLVSLGVMLIGEARLITGGVVGLAFLLHYASGIGFGKLFFIINMPFYLFAIKRMGWAFALKTLIAVVLLSVFAEALPAMLTIEALAPAYAAAMGGLLMGIGLLVLFRHRASLGGFNVVVLYLQQRFGWRAGLMQLLLDAVIMLASVPMISPGALGLSLVGAAVLNLSLAINHRPGRYMAI